MASDPGTPRGGLFDYDDLEELERGKEAFAEPPAEPRAEPPAEPRAEKGLPREPALPVSLEQLEAMDVAALAEEHRRYGWPLERGLERRDLVEQLRRARGLEERGVPVRRLGSLASATRLAEAWQGFEAMSREQLAEECAKMGFLPVEEGQDPLARLRAASLLAELPLSELQRECTRQGLPCAAPSLLSSEERHRRILVDRLVLELGADAYEHEGIPARRLGSLAATARLAERWESIKSTKEPEAAKECGRLGLAPCLGAHTAPEILKMVALRLQEDPPGSMAMSKTLLVCGPQGSGKTALIRRFAEGAWAADLQPTVGLDESAGRILLDRSSRDLPDALRLLLPDEGLELVILEIGGSKGGHLRGVPRGRPIDGILVCYDLCDRDSFHNVAHLLLQHRTDRHLRHQSSAVVALDEEGPAQLAAAICGNKADAADVDRPRQVGGHEALAFAQKSGVRFALTASAKTGRGVDEVFYSIAAAILEADEEAEADRIVARSAPPPVQNWGLRLPGASGSGPAMTSPRGERPHEPASHSPAQRLVEVIDTEGTASVARTLETCLERGLLHRAVHVWLYDPRSGGMLLRKYAALSPKHPGRWGPSSHGEVLCYGSTNSILTGPHTSEVSINAAQRLMREQLGVDLPPKDLEHWFSCTSREGSCKELLDVYTVQLGSNLPSIRLSRDEEVEWVHFTDIFGAEAAVSGRLFHIEETYRNSMVGRMRSRILHADREG